MTFKLGTSGNPAGRPKGHRSRIKVKPAQMQQASIDSGLTPLDFALNMLRDVTADHKDRIWACTAALPYVHARLAHQTYSGPDGGNIVIEIVKFIEEGRVIEGEATEQLEAEAIPTEAVAVP